MEDLIKKKSNMEKEEEKKQPNLIEKVKDLFRDKEINEEAVASASTPVYLPSERNLHPDPLHKEKGKQK